MEVSQPTRRSTRKSSAKALNVELTPRKPLKRTKRGAGNLIPAAAVNGSADAESAEDEESPSKKSRLETEGAVADSIDENEMDVQETNENTEKNEDQEMIPEEDPPPSAHQQKINSGAFGDMNFTPLVVLERCHCIHADHQGTDWTRVQPSRREPVASTKSAAQLKQPENRREVHIPKITSMAEYKKKMEAKAESTGIRRVNHYVLRPCSTSEVTYTTTRQRVNNIPPQKQNAQQKKQAGVKKSVTKGSSGFSCRGFIQYLGGLLLLVLLSSAVLLAYKNVHVLHWESGGGSPSRPVKPEVLAAQLSVLETQFPSQHTELWKKSRIHLEKHLQTAQPTEPVSLILTAGRRAERTLHCLAQGLASAFSAALNSSVLQIDGASKAVQDSDQVKLDIDRQLRAAFEGDKHVAVVHRFEELPPASTLIFYRYCDHENAAYKHVFLVFTVLLPQEELEGKLHLKDVEEKVYDYIKDKFLGSSNQTAFNKMDLDKFGGLWSRISHLILPVTAENEGNIEQNGC